MTSKDQGNDSDTDIEDGPIDPTRRWIGMRSPVEIYCTACKQERLTPIPDFIQQLGSAQIILKNKSLLAKDIAPIIISLVNDLEVQELHLPGNNIGERGMHFITDFMLEKDIKILDVSRNKLGIKGAVALAEIISGSPHLRELSAAGNDLREKDVFYLVNVLQSNITLKTLDLSHNEFSEDGGVLLGHMLEKNDYLTALNLSWNHLRLKGATAICAGLSHNVMLAHLDLSWNGFGNEGAKAMCDALKINNALKSLDLTNNRINAIGASDIAKALKINDTLQVIRLGQNPISSLGALKLMCAIRDNENSAMVEVDIDDVPVTYDLQVVIQDVQDRTPEFKVRHGEFVKTADVIGMRLLSSEFTIDPFKLLMVYAQKAGLRLWDVFAQFDKDGSMSISKDEFKQAIKTASIPITDKNLNLLVKQLDKDGDGEVDFSELVEFQKDYLLKERKRKALEAAIAEQEKEMVRLRREKLGEGSKRTLPSGAAPQGGVETSDDQGIVGHTEGPEDRSGENTEQESGEGSREGSGMEPEADSGQGL